MEDDLPKLPKQFTSIPHPDDLGLLGQRPKLNIPDEMRFPPHVPKGMTPEKLRTLADWLDIYDRMGQVFVDAVERGGDVIPDEVAEARGIVGGTEVQDDLRRWADEIEAQG